MLFALNTYFRKFIVNVFAWIEYFYIFHIIVVLFSNAYIKYSNINAMYINILYIIY